MQSSRLRGTIWVVDDSATDAERVAACLRDEFTVVLFHDGPAALERLASSEPPDLLLLDWVMPGMSGLEICSYVRSSRAPMSQLPIILLTSQHRSSEITQAFKSGANDYIVKPFVDEELKARVRTLTSSKRHLERAQNLVAALQRSEERLLLATSSAGVGIWEWDIRSGAVMATDIHRKIFELSPTGPITFNDLAEKVHPDDRQSVRHHLNASIENKTDYASEFQILKSDGSIAWISGAGRAVYDDSGKPLRMVGIHLDVSSQKKSEAELTRAKEEAERANQMKSAFLANMSHEIRTPLGAMLGFANLMQDPSITAMELSQYLEVLSRNGEQLSVIINDILDLSKVEAGLLAYEQHEFDLRNVIEGVVVSFRAKAKEMNLSLEYVPDSSTPVKAVTDLTRVRQILMNLVSNALKFTRAGGIQIRSSAKTDSSGKKFLVFEVKDTGIGIPQEQFDRIFEMFVQGDDSITRKFGGTGIGLALSRKLARELGGDLVLVESGKGKGSLFRASVENHPLAIEVHKPVVVPSESDRLPNLDGVRVLVVDDSPDNQHLILRYLTRRGAVVDLAGNGLDGYQKALRNSYDVVLMDLQMPVMDGYTATKQLRNEGYGKPIIALTAHAMSEISARCIEVGCNSYLPKPINPKNLVEAIAAYSKSAGAGDSRTSNLLKNLKDT